MDWQPIETAPRDGTPILLWAHMDWRDELIPVTGWYARGSGEWVCHADWFNPTHWMPLPVPPATLSIVE
jgi:hypothetical protein